MSDVRDAFLPEERPEIGEALYISFEKESVPGPGDRYRWVIGLSDGQSYKKTTLPYKNFDQLADQIHQYQSVFNLNDQFDIYSVHEISREGHSFYRELVERGFKPFPIDGASPDGKKNNPGKTDRLDARKLVRLLVHYIGGDREVFSVVNTPDRGVEQARELSRERATLKDERKAHLNRIRSLLFKHGIDRGVDQTLLDQLDDLTTSTGHPLGNNLKQRIRREYERLQLVNEQLKSVASDMKETVQQQKNQSELMQKVARLYMVKSFGLASCYELVTEAFGWRNFQNRGQVTGYFGLDDVPFRSGHHLNQTGISKHGHDRLRALAVQLAWSWTRHQPDSELTEWFRDRCKQAGSDSKNKYIIALARKLMNRIRVYLDTGELPNGAVLKTNPTLSL